MIFTNWVEVLRMAEETRAESLKLVPAAMVPRVEARIRGKTLIVNLPGAPGAVRENLAIPSPPNPHAVEKIHEEGGECAPAP